MPVLKSPFKGNFSLNSSGVAGFFGGEESFAAMNSVHLIPSRRWFGWYNSPGSYFVAKKYGTLPTSTFWDGLFPGPALEPAELLEIDAKKPGPRYTGVYSGTRHAKTGHLCYLLNRRCRMKKAMKICTSVTTPNDKIPFTIVEFPENLLEWPEDSDYQVPQDAFPKISPLGQIGILITILTSISLGVLSALYGDGYSSGLILFGAAANGITLLVLGSGVLRINLAQVGKHVPPGDGILFDETSITLLLGPERTISTILRSRYQLQFKSKSYARIGFCCILLLLQFLFQLLLIPQGKLIGQVLFLVTLAVSWICNGYLASKDLENIQTDILFSIIGKPKIVKVNLQRWTEAVALAIFFLSKKKATPNGVIDELLPNDTPAWNLWKECMRKAVKDKTRPTQASLDTICEPGESLSIFQQFSPEERSFVSSIVKQAENAYDSVAELSDTLTKTDTKEDSVLSKHNNVKEP